MVTLVLLYDSPLWGSHAHNSVVMKNMAPVKRRIALRITLLLAGMAPIWLLYRERANVWERQQREEEIATLLNIKREAQAALLQEWKGEWNA